MASKHYFAPKSNQIIIYILILVTGISLLSIFSLTYYNLNDPLHQTLIGSHGQLTKTYIFALIFLNIVGISVFSFMIFCAYHIRKSGNHPFMIIDEIGIHMPSPTTTESFLWNEIRLAEISGDELYIYMKLHNIHEPPRTLRIPGVQFDQPQEVANEIMNGIKGCR